MLYLAYGYIAAKFRADIHVTDGNPKLRPLCLNLDIHVHVRLNDTDAPHSVCDNLLRASAESPFLEKMLTDQCLTYDGFILSLKPGDMDICGANDRSYLKTIDIFIDFYNEVYDVHVLTYRLSLLLDYAMHCSWDAAAQVAPSLEGWYDETLKLLELSRLLPQILGPFDTTRLGVACENTARPPKRKPWNPHKLRFMAHTEYMSGIMEVLDSEQDQTSHMVPLNAVTFPGYGGQGDDGHAEGVHKGKQAILLESDDHVRIPEDNDRAVPQDLPSSIYDDDSYIVSGAGGGSRSVQSAHLSPRSMR